MDAQEATPEEVEKLIEEGRARKKKQRELRQQRAMEQAAAARRAPGPVTRHEIDEDEVVASVVEDIPALTPLKIPKPAEKVPYVVGNKPTKPKQKPKGVGLTKRLEAAIDLPARDIESVRNYCEYAGIDPDRADVGDCLVHNLFHWAMKGSSPHIKELFERIDGKVVKTDEQNANGKMSITAAMNMIEQKPKDSIDESGEG